MSTLAGERSLLFFWGGGAAKPKERGGYAGLLAFWCGGAHGYPFIPAPPGPIPPVLAVAEGLSFAKHLRERPIIDDAEVLEFLQMWTLWNDVE